MVDEVGLQMGAIPAHQSEGVDRRPRFLLRIFTRCAPLLMCEIDLISRLIMTLASLTMLKHL